MRRRRGSICGIARMRWGCCSRRPRGLAGARFSIGCRGVLDSFIQWCEWTRKDFQLDEQIEELLRKRQNKLVLNHTYGQWRAMQKEDPQMCRMMRFKDNPRKPDIENLSLEIDTIPIWRPGHPMRGEQ